MRGFPFAGSAPKLGLEIMPTSGPVVNALKAFLFGRSNRSEYWISVVCMTIACMVANVAVRQPTLISTLSFIPWVVIASRRLRDFGRSPWWCVSTVVGGFVLGFVGGIINTFAMAEGGSPPLTTGVMTVGYAVVTWGIIIYIGSQKSAPSRKDRGDIATEAALLRTFD